MDSCRLGPVRPGRGEQRVGGEGGGGRRSWWSRRGSPWRMRWGRRSAGLLSGMLRIVQQAAKHSYCYVPSYMYNCTRLIYYYVTNNCG